jgi:hypothetical protein
MLWYSNAEMRVCSIFIEWILWFIVDILILLIVGVVCIKQAVTVGGNARLIFGKKTENIEDF